MPEVVARYREISQEEQRLFAVPMDNRVLQKLVWPLRHAKGSYALGNYLGTIALCGFVAEMVAILLFEMTELSIDGRPLDEGNQDGLFGASFEKLGQERRAKVLVTYGIIDRATLKELTDIRVIRRRYLHLLSKDHNKLAADAARTFNLAVSVVVKAMGLGIANDGRVAVSAAFLRYVEKGRTTEAS